MRKGEMRIIRSVLMTLETLKISYEVKSVEVESPRHSVSPVLQEGDFVLAEGRAIMCHLATSRGAVDLYPKVKNIGFPLIFFKK